MAAARTLSNGYLEFLYSRRLSSPRGGHPDNARLLADFGRHVAAAHEGLAQLVGMACLVLADPPEPGGGRADAPPRLELCFLTAVELLGAHSPDVWAYQAELDPRSLALLSQLRRGSPGAFDELLAGLRRSCGAADGDGPWCVALGRMCAAGLWRRPPPTPAACCPAPLMARPFS
jgi:hypothetical protein